ncbi:Hypothetical protein CINCED_3A010237, partial [Cinara cedri]
YEYVNILKVYELKQIVIYKQFNVNYFATSQPSAFIIILFWNFHHVQFSEFCFVLILNMSIH